MKENELRRAEKKHKKSRSRSSSDDSQSGSQSSRSRNKKKKVDGKKDLIKSSAKKSRSSSEESGEVRNTSTGKETHSKEPSIKGTEENKVTDGVALQ
jgi:hypothetical protein